MRKINLCNLCTIYVGEILCYSAKQVADSSNNELLLTLFCDFRHRYWKRWTWVQESL